MISSFDARFELWINKSRRNAQPHEVQLHFANQNSPNGYRVSSTVIILTHLTSGPLRAFQSHLKHYTIRLAIFPTNLPRLTAEMGLCYSRPRRDAYGRRVYSSSSYRSPRKVEVVHVHHGGGGYVAPPLVAPISSGYSSGYGTSRITTRRGRRYY